MLAWCERATQVGLSGIALPEIVAAFCRLRREGQVTAAQYRQLKARLLADITDIAVCDLSPEVMRQAVWSLETDVLRGMDAIHIGSAVALEAELFISADKRQCAAAAHAGLQVTQV